MIELPKAQDKAQALTGLCEFLVEIEETSVYQMVMMADDAKTAIDRVHEIFLDEGPERMDLRDPHIEGTTVVTSIVP